VQGYTLRVIRNELKSDNLNDKSSELFQDERMVGFDDLGFDLACCRLQSMDCNFIIVAGALFIGQHYGALTPSRLRSSHGFWRPLRQSRFRFFLLVFSCHC